MTLPETACPDLRERSLWHSRRLWSLLDMLRFYAATFASSVGAIQRAAQCLQMVDFMNLPEDHAEDRRFVREALTEAMSGLEGLPVSRIVNDQLKRLVSRIDRLTSPELKILLEEFNNNLLTDLMSSWFLMIPASQREFYEQTNPPFGDAVTQAFPEASLDIAAASRCLALDEWTACVFHLMRVLEHGLWKLAAEVHLDADAMAHENWKNIIDQIERKIRDIEAEPKSPKKSERLKTLSAVAAQFRYFKDAWRNHVSHSRVSYDKLSGEPVWTHVRAFMQDITASVSPASSPGQSS